MVSFSLKIFLVTCSKNPFKAMDFCFFFNLLETSADQLKNESVFVTPWTIAHQDPLSIVFSRQEQRSGLTIPFSRESSKPKD